MGDLASHSDNNHGGSRLFRTLEIGDRLRLRKGLEFLEVEFEGLDDSFGDHPRARIVDEIPTNILRRTTIFGQSRKLLEGDSIPIDMPLNND